MEVAVISVESIKPSSSAHHLKPFKLCLLDQLTPTTYSPLVVFYHMNNENAKLRTSCFSDELKCSLSKTLTSFYPLAGRVKDNFIVNDFDQGVPYIEARVNGRLVDFLQPPEMELLSQFLPYEPFCHQTDSTAAQIAVQVNTFDCGGIAIGMCFSHKIVDGATWSCFLKSWISNANGSCNNVVHPDLSEAASLFPPLESLLPYFTSLMENLWFSDTKCRTRRFVFNANAVATLRSKTQSNTIKRPTRAEAFSAFIGKYAMEASRSASGSAPRPSVLTQGVNIRRLTTPRLSNHAIGNLVWPAIANNTRGNTQMEMHELVALIRNGVAGVNTEYLQTLRGDKGSVPICDHLNRVAEISEGDPDVFSFSWWHRFSFSDLDFGWGKPTWVGISGETGHPSDSNNMVLKDNGRENAIEAWMMLAEEITTILEHTFFHFHTRKSICLTSLNKKSFERIYLY